jgi:histidinol-phosphate/aromatic aminotransferase/cobyric acid decarboxylase-like protein
MATVRRVREERARLFRMLRKLNMLQPYPSWANYSLARIERGSAAEFAANLARRNIIIHHPPHPELAHFFRISATQPAATDALRHALIAYAAYL